MPSSIIIDSVAWSVPGEDPLFSGLTLRLGREKAGLVGRNGIGKTTLLKLMTGELAPDAGTVAVDGSLGVLRQTVRVGGAERVADLFGVGVDLDRLCRAEAGEASLDEDTEIDWSLRARAAAALARLRLETPLETRLNTLSGGQRTRAALAAVVFGEPDFLLLDEPTNNLDREGRDAVIGLLTGWRSGAVVVSHDRELLETMDAIVELTTLGAKRYGGGWSAFREMKDQELAAARRGLLDAEKRLAGVERQAQTTGERQARRMSAGKRQAARADMPRIMIGKRKEQSEGTSGANARLAGRRREEAAASFAAARERVEVLEPITVTLPPTNLAARTRVVRLEGVTAGYDRERPILRDLTFGITGPERVALTGPNGCGKSTLLAVITRRVVPWAGEARTMTAFAVLDQQISVLDPSASIRDNFRRLNPGVDENACRASLARFRFRADAVLQAVATLSGGQILRAGLACVLGGPELPGLLILDEPTNHLDLESIEAVEAGLRAFDGALLVVSHDRAFLDGVGTTRTVELLAGGMTRDLP